MNLEICRHLRTKKIYIPAQAGEAFSQPSEPVGGSSHCWCNRTQAETGPDDWLASPEYCKPGRKCHQND